MHTTKSSPNAATARHQFFYEPRFDYLRIALASIVMFSHDNIVTWSRAGNLAVQVFFALSGWLIGRILLKTSKSDIFDFYYNRALRIWIPYYIGVFLLAAASLLKESVTPAWIEFFFYKATFVYNFFGPPQLAQRMTEMPLTGTGNHFWSVNAEEQFYLLAPVVLTLTVKRLPSKMALWFLATLLAFKLNFYPAIFLGVAASLIEKAHPGAAAHSCAKPVAAAVSVTTFALLLTSPGKYDLLAPFFSVAIVILLAGAGSHSATGKFLGGISYPLYLNHWIGVFAANALARVSGLEYAPLRQAVACIISYAVAAALYLTVDRVIKENRERFRTKRVAVAITVIAYGTPVLGILGGLHYSGIL